jgi:hypothetical protein
MDKISFSVILTYYKHCVIEHRKTNLEVEGCTKRWEIDFFGIVSEIKRIYSVYFGIANYQKIHFFLQIVQVKPNQMWFIFVFKNLYFSTRVNFPV